MAQRIYRIIFFLFIAAGTIRLSAQTPSNDIGVSLVLPKLDTSTVADEDGDATISFDEDLGFGLSVNHFWSERFSTELAVQKYSADLNLDIDTIEADSEFNAGDVDVMSLTAMAQMHFMRAARFSPYVGAGLARVWGEFDPVEFDGEEDGGAIDLDPELTWAAALGANVRLTDRVFLTGEMKYIPWEAIAEGDTSEDSVDLNPITFAAGVKVRF